MGGNGHIVCAGDHGVTAYVANNNTIIINGSAPWPHRQYSAITCNYHGTPCGIDTQGRVICEITGGDVPLGTAFVDLHVAYHPYDGDDGYGMAVAVTSDGIGFFWGFDDALMYVILPSTCVV